MRSTLAQKVVAGAFGLTVLGVSSHSLAFCRGKACDDKPSYEDIWQETPDPSCKRDTVGCLLAGEVLFWPPRCISYTVQKDGAPSEGISFETLDSVIAQAFETWKAADCGGRRPSIVVENLGPVSCGKAEYSDGHPNANIVTFRERSWPKTADHPLALTTVTYNRETAEIYDVDIEINSFGADFTTTNDPASGKFDLLSVLTHEVGHFFGLSHVTASTTMNPFYSPAQRTLTLDDMAGICDIFPPVRMVDAETCGPRHGFSSECAPPEAKKGCAMASGQKNATGFALVIPLALALGIRRRRRPER
jgi:hypothetical protein